MDETKSQRHSATPTEQRPFRSIGQYRLKYAQPVDLFCYTGGIENAALFERVEDKF